MLRYDKSSGVRPYDKQAVEKNNYTAEESPAHFALLAMVRVAGAQDMQTLFHAFAQVLLNPVVGGL